MEYRFTTEENKSDILPPESTHTSKNLEYFPYQNKGDGDYLNAYRTGGRSLEQSTKLKDEQTHDTDQLSLKKQDISKESTQKASEANEQTQEDTLDT